MNKVDDNSNGLQFRGLHHRQDLSESRKRGQESEKVVRNGKYHDFDDPNVLFLVVAVRALSFIVWTGAILYATFQVYITAEGIYYFQLVLTNI